MAVRQLINLFRGSVRLTVSGDFPERFLNLCAQKQIAFWGLERRESHTLCLTVAWRGHKRLVALAEQTGCCLTWGEVHGLPPFLLRFRKRYAFLVGLLFAIMAVCFLTRFILVVEVEGNERVPTQTILAALQKQGLRVGAYAPRLETRELSTQLLLELEDLAWATVNLHGIRAQVIVRETVESPELIDESLLGDVVARVSGVVVSVEPWSGDPLVAAGDTVSAGDILIRGAMEMEAPEYSGQESRWRFVRAMGKVEGRTWRSMTLAIPLSAAVKQYTGERQTVWSINFFGNRVNFSQNSRISSGSYDKIKKTWSLTLPDGITLPFSVSREVYRDYTTTECEIDRENAQRMLEQQLLIRLGELLGENGSLEQYSFETTEADGLLSVTLNAECYEELGRFVPTETRESISYKGEH